MQGSAPGKSACRSFLRPGLARRAKCLLRHSSTRSRAARSPGAVLELEVENASAAELEVVLRLTKETGAHVVAFQAEGYTRVPSVIGAATSLYRVGVTAACRGLRLFVCAAENSMQPGFPPFLAPGDLRPGPVQCELYVFVLENRGGISRSNVSLDPEPAVWEVKDGRFNADGVGIKERGPETDPSGA